ncbi:MAG: metallophosphoesterase family protein [Cyanobacteria bacterium J06632_22]
MRLFAIGDIHGCSTALQRLLAALDLRPTDRVVTLGDYINKGPDTKGVLDQLVTLAETGQLIALRGNHELKMLAARTQQALQIKDEVLLDSRTLASYGVSSTSTRTKGVFAQIPEHHWQFVTDHCRDWWESEQHIFTHANLDPQKPLAEQPPRKLFWEKFENPQPHMSGKTLVCGHTRQKSGNPVNLGHAICIDTWACGEGWLTGLEVNSGALWQVNQRGKIKRTHVDHFRSR